MTTTISATLFNALRKGKEQLSTEALHRILCFVESQRTEDSAFKDKSGKADLYYTSFGLTLSYLLGMKNTDAYLRQQTAEHLDLVHYAAFMRCKRISRLMRYGKAGLLPTALFPTKIKPLEAFKVIPNGDIQSPYTQFLWLSLREDAGQRIKDRKRIMDSLAGYQAPRGGYMNTKDGGAATTNATVAALAIKGRLGGYKANEDVFHLRDSQDVSGGFRAAEVSPVPDLLSTATALFLLSCYRIRPNYPAREFIEAHWLDSGGFAATLPEDSSDVEYTFYGLLALGSI
ncbi:MAG: hypothetical protein LBV32_06050 [Tannerellaceae bacterium]|jgi:prenyltransferase beta subunit|nr:hypothetical protein [Tannerellaceae bacterium]